MHVPADAIPDDCLPREYCCHGGANTGCATYDDVHLTGSTIRIARPETSL